MSDASFPPEVPYLVAAIDHTHGGRVATARQLVVKAAAAGAHAVKLGIRGTSGAVAPELRSAPWQGEAVHAGSGRTREEFYRSLDLEPKAVASLRDEARSRISFIAAPYDLEAVKIARTLEPDAYQIDSGILGHPEVVRAVGKTGRPVFVVAGTCTDATIAAALEALEEANVVLLHTVTAVPLAPEATRLGYLSALRKRFGRPVGYLGWEDGTAWALVAATLGAQVIEKPFTLDRSLGGPFDRWSLDPGELASLAGALRQLPAVLASQGARSVLPEELDVLADTSHSLVAKRRLTRGTRLRASHFDIKPGLNGLSPRLLGWIEGRQLLYDLDSGEALTFGLVS